MRNTFSRKAINNIFEGKNTFLGNMFCIRKKYYFCSRKYLIVLQMETIVRKNTSFRLRTDLLERLKQNAAKVNRTLNNYVESVLLDVVYDEPNDITKAAIAEAMSGRNQNKVYDSVDDLLDDLSATE